MYNVVRDERNISQRGGCHRHGLIWDLCLSTDRNKEVIIQITNGPPDGGLWIMGEKIKRFVLYIMYCRHEFDKRNNVCRPKRLFNDKRFSPSVGKF